MENFTKTSKTSWVHQEIGIGYGFIPSLITTKCIFLFYKKFYIFLERALNTSLVFISKNAVYQYFNKSANFPQLWWWEPLLYVQGLLNPFRILVFFFFILSWFLNCLFLRKSINKNSKTKNYFLLTREVVLETSWTTIVLAKYFDDLSVNGSWAYGIHFPRKT